jgi:hypothetical protein
MSFWAVRDGSPHVPRDRAGAAAFGKRFRLYSVSSIVVLLAFGALTFWRLPAAGQSADAVDRAVGAYQHQRVPAVGRGAGDRAVAGRSRALATARRDAMDDVKIARVTGGVGVACVALTFGQFPLWLIGSASSVYDGSGFARHLFDIKNVAFTAS